MPSFGRDINNSRGGADRPYSGPGQPFARNGFRNEPFKDVNFRVSWGLEFAGTRKVIVTADFFNIFNWENIQLAGHRRDELLCRNRTGRLRVWCSDQSRTSCPSRTRSHIGDVRAADSHEQPGAPRQVQLGVRFEF